MKYLMTFENYTSSANLSKGAEIQKEKERLDTVEWDKDIQDKKDEEEELEELKKTLEEDNKDDTKKEKK